MTLPAPRPDADATLAAEVGGDLQRALRRQIDHIVREWRTALAAVERQQRGYVTPGERDDLAGLREFTRMALDTFARIGEEGGGKIDHLAPHELDWHTIAAEWTLDAAAGQALWEQVKRTARDELAGGKTGAEAVEGHYSRPIERATYLAIRAALAEGLRPRNGMEWLLIDGMAEAWVIHLRWVTRHAQTDSIEAVRLERDLRERGEWQPPRLSDAEAVDRAAMMADRFQRQFLRLMRAYRDQRRLLGAVVVGPGGQLNVAEQQVNLSEQRTRLTATTANTSADSSDKSAPTARPEESE